MENLLKQHETYKLKGYKLTTEDLFEWNTLLEAMLDLRVEMRSKLFEAKNDLENRKSTRRLVLKDEKDEAGKKKHTENTMDCLIGQEFQEEDQKYLVEKAKLELLENKISVIPEYIQLGKRFLPTM